MHARIEKAIEELECTTDALLQLDEGDLVAICGALERRSDAVTRIAQLVAEIGDGTALERLSKALERGELATRRVLKMKQDATEEWARLQQLLHGLDSARRRPDTNVDCAA
jgi:hypothetical protein